MLVSDIYAYVQRYQLPSFSLSTVLIHSPTYSCSSYCWVYPFSLGYPFFLKIPILFCLSSDRAFTFVIFYLNTLLFSTSSFLISLFPRSLWTNFTHETCVLEAQNLVFYRSQFHSSQVSIESHSFFFIMVEIFSNFSSNSGFGINSNIVSFCLSYVSSQDLS